MRGYELDLFQSTKDFLSKSNDSTLTTFEENFSPKSDVANEVIEKKEVIEAPNPVLVQKSFDEIKANLKGEEHLKEVISKSSIKVSSEEVTSYKVFRLADSNDEYEWELSKNSTTPLKILVLGDVSTESNEATEILEGEKYKLLARLFWALGLKKHEVGFGSFIEKEVNNVSRSSNSFYSLTKYKPKYILTLGAAPLCFLNFNERLNKVHGKELDLDINGTNFKVIPIFHPEYLLVNPNLKKTHWERLDQVSKLTCPECGYYKNLKTIKTTNERSL